MAHKRESKGKSDPRHLLASQAKFVGKQKQGPQYAEHVHYLDFFYGHGIDQGKMCESTF
jgi:hypothetical protein